MSNIEQEMSNDEVSFGCALLLDAYVMTERSRSIPANKAHFVMREVEGPYILRYSAVPCWIFDIRYSSNSTLILALQSI
jgi:hypothetical protein